MIVTLMHVVCNIHCAVMLLVRESWTVGNMAQKEGKIQKGL